MIILLLKYKINGLVSGNSYGQIAEECLNIYHLKDK